jgi:hypothetical protein
MPSLSPTPDAKTQPPQLGVTAVLKADSLVASATPLSDSTEVLFSFFYTSSVHQYGVFSGSL